MDKKENIISKANKWAATLWGRANSRWAVRMGQDRNYRSHVIHPAIASIFRELFADEPVSVLDLGCGDGVALTEDVGKEVLDGGGSYFGVDISDELIGKARSLRSQGNASFMEGNITDPEMLHRVNINRWPVLGISTGSRK